LIVDTSLMNRMPIAFNISSISVNAYVNEQVDCKWSRKDKSYDNMETSMSCLSDPIEMNGRLVYQCSTALDGLKNMQENNFYFKCKDQPTLTDSKRNVNQQSYPFTLIGTQPLVIDSAKPNGTTIKDSTTPVKVTLEAKTSAGYSNGDATCYYKKANADYIMFYYSKGTSAYEHLQDLHLSAGDYEYSIKCIDLGGNADTKNVTFSVESDASSPAIIRTYHEDTYLKIITDEKAECVYDTKNCNYAFDDGIKINSINDINQFTDWNTNADLFIKCRDEYGNQPYPNECSIIVRAFEGI